MIITSADVNASTWVPRVDGSTKTELSVKAYVDFLINTLPGITREDETNLLALEEGTAIVIGIRAAELNCRDESSEDQVRYLSALTTPLTFATAVNTSFAFTLHLVGADMNSEGPAALRTMTATLAELDLVLSNILREISDVVLVAAAGANTTNIADATEDTFKTRGQCSVVACIDDRCAAVQFQR